MVTATPATLLPTALTFGVILESVFCTCRNESKPVSDVLHPTEEFYSIWRNVHIQYTYGEEGEGEMGGRGRERVGGKRGRGIGRMRRREGEWT